MQCSAIGAFLLAGILFRAPWYWLVSAGALAAVAWVAAAWVARTNRNCQVILAQQENARLSAILSVVEEGVVFADAANVVVEVNDYLCRFMAKKRSEILGKRIEDLHGGPAMDKILRQVDRFRSEVPSRPLVLQRPLRGAEVILRVQPIYRAGKYDGVLLNVVDVSELVEARRQAVAASAAKGQFLTNMSHEIRTPMTAILGFADLLTDASLDPGVRNDYLAVIRRNGERLLHVIDDILDLSRIEAGGFSLNVQACRVVSIVNSVANMIRPHAEKRGNALSVEFTGGLPEAISTDGERLRQILAKLVGNAVKFTENGSVLIRTSFLHEWRRAQPAVQIDVVDTGIGINKEVLARLFRPFSQGDGSESRQFGGTGLGLAISRYIAELLGGELTVDSRLGQGSTFRLVVPTGDLCGVRMLEPPSERLGRIPAIARHVGEGPSGGVSQAPASQTPPAGARQ